ncbi:MAG: hypothetical protein VZR56_08500 [Treponema sp.]|nr:hypothetical protein [Treponema sp.]
MDNLSILSERKVLEKIIDLLLEEKIFTDDLQFKYNKEKEISDDEKWFDYVQKSGWVFQGHEFGKRIRLMNPDGIRVAKAPKKDDFIANCRKLLRSKLIDA